MESALIVSSSIKAAESFSELLGEASISQIAIAGSAAEARRLLLERDFELVLINAPLRDESGESLSRQAASKGISQVILAVKDEHYGSTSASCEGDGVLTVSKPVNKLVLLSALKLAKSAQNRMKRVQAENAELKRKIEEIRIIDRAKCILISHVSMSEKDAHRYIEKQAMDMRTTKRTVAEGILKIYES